MPDIVETTGAPTDNGDASPTSSTPTPAPEVEASGAEYVTMFFAEIPVTMPASVDDWDLDVVEAFESNHVIEAMRGFLGTDGYDEMTREFRKRYGRKPRMGDLKPFMDGVAEQYGFAGAGE